MIELDTLRERIKDSPSLALMDDIEVELYPTPIDASGKDEIYVGRIRYDISLNTRKAIFLWCCGDQIRKGAALNAVQFAELLV